MRVVLVICIQVIICQISETKSLIPENKYFKEYSQFNENAFGKAGELSRMLEVYDQNHLRSISDLWQSIKNTAVNTWHHIKNIAIKTKEKILEMIKKIKDKIDDIQSRFKERFTDLQNQINEMMANAIKIGQNVKKCLQEEKEAIDNIVKEILRNVTLCVSDSILHLSHLERTLAIEFNEKEFQNKLDSRLDECISKGDVDEECLHGLRGDLFTEVEAIESEVLQTGTHTRNVAEEIFNVVITCTSEGLVAASTNITLEAINIIKCVEDESEATTTTTLVA